MIDIRLGDFRNTITEPGDFVLSDPPYGNLFKHTRKRFGGFVVPGDDLDFLYQLFDLCSSVPALLDFTGFSRYEAAAATRHGMRIVGNAVWDKKVWGIGYNFRPRHEYLLLFSRKPVKALVRNLPPILECAPVRPKIHPTQKPVPLLRRLIEAFTEPGATIYDPFMGSAVACVESGRDFVGSDINENWVNIARSRVGVSVVGRDAA